MRFWSRQVFAPLLSAAVLLLLYFVPMALAAQNPGTTTASNRALLQHRFKPGQHIRYHVTLESISDTRQTGSIQDSQGPGSVNVTWEAIIRLDVSSAPSAGKPTSTVDAPLILRLTYESSDASVRSDVMQPQTAAIERQYAALAGRSLEITLAPNGEVAEVHGLEDLVTDDRARLAAEQWIVQLSSTPLTAGAQPGGTWNSTQAADLPIAGLAWRTESTYLRDEPCKPPTESANAPIAPTPVPTIPTGPGRANCAVILSRLALVPERNVRDPTPESYRRNNLRTSGRWSGSGQALLYVSLDTGWVVSSTQETTQEMDVAITDVSPDPAVAVHTIGTVTTRSQVSLLTDADAATPQAAAIGTAHPSAKPAAQAAPSR